MEDTVDQAHSIVPCALADIIEDARWVPDEGAAQAGAGRSPSWTSAAARRVCHKVPTRANSPLQ